MVFNPGIVYLFGICVHVRCRICERYAITTRTEHRLREMGGVGPYGSTRATCVNCVQGSTIALRWKLLTRE